MKIGSLFVGYGGLDLAVEAVTGATPAWFSEVDAAPSRILAHHWPNVPNHGDITAIDFRDVEPVDILTGGFPCQDVSHAGKRAGIAPGTRSGLWSEMHRAIQVLRPQLVVAENVRGLLSADAASDMEPCPWCVGDGGSGRPLRALGAVLGSLADIGYDAAWCGLRAADVGAPHGRFRVFITAWPAEDTHGPVGGEWRFAAPGQAPRGWAWADAGGRGRAHAADTHVPGLERPEPALGHHLPSRGDLLPTPRATDGTNGGPNQRGSSGDLMLPSAVTLLPTPVANDMGKAYTPDQWDEWTTRMQAAHGNGNGHGKSLEIEAQRLLPTPSVADVEGGRKHRSGERSGELLLNGIAAENRWSIYAEAVTRWEHLTRPAPPPTEPTGRDNAHRRLSPAFVEWMMGLPAGWVTGVPGISRNHQLKALGNGVVPQQAAAALAHLLGFAPSKEAAA